jgi:divalent metal cation (Fe/Co/Zn/Cd) transporter
VAIGLGIGPFVSGVLGWLLVMKKRVFQCSAYGATVSTWVSSRVLLSCLAIPFALVADGLESLTDVVSGLVVYFGLKIAAKPPDANHLAVVVSLALMVAAVAIIYEGIRESIEPSGAPAPYTLVLLAGAFVIKGFLFRQVASVGESIGSHAVKSDA